MLSLSQLPFYKINEKLARKWVILHFIFMHYGFGECKMAHTKIFGIFKSVAHV